MEEAKVRCGQQALLAVQCSGSGAVGAVSVGAYRIGIPKLLTRIQILPSIKNEEKP
jgi:hypothetical protein